MPMPVPDSSSVENELFYGEFPVGFKFGTSSIAHQIEGTCDGDGKGLSVWDEFSNSHPKCIADRSTANEACDSYNRFEDDVVLLRSMNSNAYSFSLNWSRILPDGTLNSINQAGLNYYDSIINTLLENGIEPVVVLYDWDMPLDLMQKYAGGWMNENIISEFVTFAKFCFQRFGDRVQQWITVAQPWMHSWKSYGDGSHPPNLCLGKNGAFVASTNLLKAHAQVYRLYEEEFQSTQNGKVGISFGIDASEDMAVLQLGRVLYPLVHGVYPSYFASQLEIKKTVVQMSEDGWSSVIKGSFDFVALSISNFEINNPSPQVSSSLSVENLLHILKSEFGNPEILLFCEGPVLRNPSMDMMDADRAQYFNILANKILKSITLEGCNVTGYFPGKLMDCWEWDNGYTISHGLYHVNFSHPAKRRSPRASIAFILKQLFKLKKFIPVDTL